MLEKKLERKPQLKREYTECIHEYLKLQHMREIQGPGDNTWPQFYLPHHCIIKDASVTTRLRVVFDASSKTASGVSLNDALMVGLVLQQDLFSILLRFRSFEYAIAADIAKMYRQILIEDEQAPLQRIVWRDNPGDAIKTYELLTLTYGTAPASFLATKVIHQLAELESKQFPKGALVATRDFYVDDLISGANSKDEALQIRNETTALLEKGGFVLRKWASNKADLLNDMPGSAITNQVLELDKDGMLKTLGVNWHPANDVLRYKISIDIPGSEPCTKRSILASIARIFDPLGSLGPVIVTAKVLIQKLWKLQIGWDGSLPTNVFTEWSHYVKKIQSLDGFEILRRTLRTGADVKLELHGFCDASEIAYGACIYIRIKDSLHAPEVHLLGSKSRVAPIKVLSLPRLELCGAQLLAQLIIKVKSALDLDIDKTYLWTDSSIVLHWIRATNKKLPVFVGHRIGEIQDTTDIDNWSYVGTEENPADLVSRGIAPQDLASSELWWNGPHWLQDIIVYSSKVPEVDETHLAENDRSIVAALATQASADPFDKFSTLNKLIRVAATCLRVARICKREKLTGDLSVGELEHAIKCLVKKEQQSAFREEIDALRKGTTISNKSSLKHANPFLDEENLIRVGGRLQNADIQYETKHPLVLPHRSNFTKLVIEHEHNKNLHAGVEATLAAVRLQYWPIKARGVVKKCLYKCIKCFKSRPRTSEQVMGNLPIQRVTQTRPFSSTGVYFCGPNYIFVMASEETAST